MKAIIVYIIILMAVSTCSGLAVSSSPQKLPLTIFTNSRKFIDQQKVVIRTTLVVASIAIYTKQNPQFIGSQLRQDILSGTIIFQVSLVRHLCYYIVICIINIISYQYYVILICIHTMISYPLRLAIGLLNY